MKPTSYNQANASPNSTAALLHPELRDSIQMLDEEVVSNTVQYLMKKKEIRTYHYCLNEFSDYFKMVWKEVVFGHPDYETEILSRMQERENSIYSQLMDVNNKLTIKQKQPNPLLIAHSHQHSHENDHNHSHNHSQKLQDLQHESEDIMAKINQIDNDLSDNKVQEQTNQIRVVYQKLSSEEKTKEAEEYTRKMREEQVERMRKLREQRKKEEQALDRKEAEIKQHQQELLKQKREKILIKQREYHEKRDKQKQERGERNSEYLRIKKKINEQPPLYQKLYEGFSKRYESQEQQRLNKMHKERKHCLEHLKRQKFEIHQREYEQFKEKKEKLRKQRFSVMLEENRKRLKVHSSYELPPKQPDPKDVEREKARQKREKIKQYRAIVREKFQPKVDDSKRKELMNFIETLEIGNPRVKKTKLLNGTVIEEDQRSNDIKMLGMSYLEQVKQMAAKARLKGKSEDEKVKANTSVEQKKPIDYLEQFRRNRTKYDRPSVSSLSNMKNLSYDEKVKRIMHQSQKLIQTNKQNEMMLKFGKFKTSEEILQCKEEIDQNYLEIVNMKLKLILNERKKNEEEGKFGEEKDEGESQSSDQD